MMTVCGKGIGEDHVSAIVDLTLTVDEMPTRLLKKLTELAFAYKPEVVKQPLLNSISDLATRASSPWLYETASLFFNELIKEVSRKDLGILSQGQPDGNDINVVRLRRSNCYCERSRMRIFRFISFTY